MEKRPIAHYTDAPTKLWTREGLFEGVLGCNAAGRIAVGMSGGFDVAFPPEGQGPRMLSLAVLTQGGALEWSHFHGSIDDAAVASDGWVATCGTLHTLDQREWDFLNSLVGI